MGCYCEKEALWNVNDKTIAWSISDVRCVIALSNRIHTISRRQRKKYYCVHQYTDATDTTNRETTDKALDRNPIVRPFREYMLHPYLFPAVVVR